MRARDAASPAPDARSLAEAAAAHLARFDTSAARLAQVLRRRVERWAVRSQGVLDADEIASGVEGALAAIAPVVERLTRSGALDDERHAARRAALDLQAGRSARASRARLAAAGIDAEVAAFASGRDPAAELDAAVAHARRRRLGPFGKGGEAADAQARRRALASFARAGYAPGIALRVLAMGIEEAETALGRLRERG